MHQINSSVYCLGGVEQKGAHRSSIGPCRGPESSLSSKDEIRWEHSGSNPDRGAANKIVSTIKGPVAQPGRAPAFYLHKRSDCRTENLQVDERKPGVAGPNPVRPIEL